MINYTVKVTENEIRVKLDNKIVGTIKPVIGGYQYIPKGQKSGGEIFTSLAAVKKSLEE